MPVRQAQLRHEVFVVLALDAGRRVRQSIS